MNAFNEGIYNGQFTVFQSILTSTDFQRTSFSLYEKVLTLKFRKRIHLNACGFANNTNKFIIAQIVSIA